MTYAFLDIIHPLDFFLTFYLRITDIHHINSTKLSLFAKLHERVASHKVILGERESLLKDIREKLVTDSGNVLGGALGKG